ncbi:GATOR complex protein MIOS [Contarinia nasturtii]|uniref:GATOR complex protein MIOS n=1 Tax=Contarinia nasturtii TaxID=265458 RepID=UPI0012D49DA6|nr:GATOR complex protein MIOS [Contarinia nasturtii]XP_031631807.1 GATOR complex protein MIOS [Contarinia nasturtii]
MSGTPVEIHWFPRHSNRFVTWGSEINLYQVKNTDDVDHRVSTNINLDISLATTATLLASETRYQYIRCVAPSFRSSGDLLLAVGLANGKVGLSNFVSSNENNIEFTPKQSRPTVCLSWHESETNLLAIGHDRNRSDHCITVWDTERGVPKEKSVLHFIGLSDTAHSLCWDKTGRILFAGMSHKYMKMMDLRQNSPTVNVCNTRALHGLTISANGRLLAGFVDNSISLWDIRRIEKPISVANTEKNISDISWCPSRNSTLATLQRDSPFVHLFDFHCSSPNESVTDVVTHSIKRIVSPFQKKISAAPRNITLSNISWHPYQERLLALSGSGIICDFKIPQRIAISIDALNNLCGAIGSQLNCLNTPSPPSTPCESANPWVENSNSTDHISSAGFPEDIVEVMHRRACNDYGLIQSDIQKNGDLANSEALKSVWEMLARIKQEDCGLGLKDIIGISETVLLSWQDFPNGLPMKGYKSDQRDFCRHLSGWTFDRSTKDSFLQFIDGLCAKQEYTRAAMIAVFQLKIRLAIDILSKGADNTLESSNLRMAAIALAGFSFEKSAIWRSQCATAQTQISCPHLRALFAFLTPENGSYEKVLNENRLSIADRMAFACQYLSDSKLSDYIKTMIQTCIKTRDLHGLLLTGATPEGIKLLQSYLDGTDDVQTVALICIKFLPKDLLETYDVQYWIQSYRELLDIWRLFETRAHFDIMLSQMNTSPKHSKSVYLSCSFCGKNVSASMYDETRVRSPSSNINKLSSCPSCRKPLPRCSICLLHMGTTNGASFQNKSGSGWLSKPFSKWFAWCQSCSHGGHSEHLTSWFSTHAECPVASCSCKCFGLDFPLLPLNGIAGETTY